MSLVVAPDTTITELVLIRRHDLGNGYASEPFFAHTINVTYTSLHPLLPGELPVVSQVLDLTSSFL